MTCVVRGVDMRQQEWLASATGVSRSRPPGEEGVARQTTESDLKKAGPEPSLSAVVLDEAQVRGGRKRL